MLLPEKAECKQVEESKEEELAGLIGDYGLGA